MYSLCMEEGEEEYGEINHWAIAKSHFSHFSFALKWGLSIQCFCRMQQHYVISENVYMF